ncbi:MAG: hypothetical protein ACTSSE_18220 [Candidatus Thorarchaeota archaeon]
MKKRLGVALLGGVLTFFLLLTLFSTASTIAVLGDGHVNLSATLESVDGTMITGSSSGGNFGSAYNTEYAITYGGITVSGITFSVSWDIPGDYIDWGSLRITGKLFQILSDKETLVKLNEFSSVARTSSLPLGTYAPSTLVDYDELEIGAFAIEFKVVLLFDATAEDSNTELHTAAIGHVQTWMYNDGGKIVDGTEGSPSVAEIEGELAYDQDYTGGTGVYDSYDPISDETLYAASILPVNAGGSLIIAIVPLAVMYICYRSAK